MPKEAIFVYADTSVFGGPFDEEFAQASLAFFDQVRAGRFVLALSTVVEEELLDAPANVRSLFEALSSFSVPVEISEEVIRLQQAYIQAGIIAPPWETDALHVALATVAGCRIIVSWNFKHIVNFRKISMYNGINRLEGYSEIAIHSPQEVIL